MEVIEDSSKILYYLNDPIVSFDTNGIVSYRNSKAKNLNQLTEVRTDEGNTKSVFEFVQSKKTELKNGLSLWKVELLDISFKGEYFELSIRFDDNESEFVCYFRNITERVELENKLTKNRQTIDDHIEELMSANDILKKQNELIHKAQEEARSGLRYGKIIQEKINASNAQVSDLFSRSFTFYKPKNYIGGDLVWAQECRFGKVIAVVDCMGHGVPGAMLAMSVFHFLNSTLMSDKFESVTEFLSQVVDAYHKSFFRLNVGSDFRDTFDISVCVVDEKSRILRYRGVKRPLVILRDDELVEFKGERVSVSDSNASQIIKKEPWDKVWPYKKGDQLYMFTDGFTDQFGGLKNKKYKYNNFKKLIKTNSRQEILIQKTLLEKELWSWQNSFGESYEQTDDITVVGIEML